MSDAYQRLAQYLDSLPASYPATPDGLELRILEHLFTPQEAELALHLSLLDQPVLNIAKQAGLSLEVANTLLESMLRKGLISGNHPEGKEPQYSISQFVVGFYEGQVNRLDLELVQLFEAYAPFYFEHGSWKKLPQMRTIPVMQAIPITSEVLPYMQVEAILRAKTEIAVRNCVCRQERELLDKGCGKPMESCLSFDGAARSTVQNDNGRMITFEEAMQIIQRAQAEGMVLQPSNSQNPIFLCTCCSCCCGVLRHIKEDPNPGKLVANPFVVRYDPGQCIACGACTEICPMEALSMYDSGEIHFAQERCIGCGLCVGVCLSGALEMALRDEPEQPKIPRNTADTYVQIAKARGVGSLLGAGLGILKRLVR